MAMIKTHRDMLAFAAKVHKATGATTEAHIGFGPNSAGYVTIYPNEADAQATAASLALVTDLTFSDAEGHEGTRFFRGLTGPNGAIARGCMSRALAEKVEALLGTGAPS